MTTVKDLFEALLHMSGPNLALAALCVLGASWLLRRYPLLALLIAGLGWWVAVQAAPEGPLGGIDVAGMLVRLLASLGAYSIFERIARPFVFAAVKRHFERKEARRSE